MRDAIRAFAAAALLGALLLNSAPARAIMTTDAGRQDAKRFGLNQLRPLTRRAPSSKSIAAFADFNARNGGRWVLRFDERTGLPSSLAEGVAPPRPGGPEAAALSFIAEQHELLGVDPASLSKETVSTQDRHRHVLYRQSYRGLPVEFARVKVHLDESGSVLGVNSRFEPDLALDVNPAVSEALAAAAVQSDIGGPAPRGGSLVILPGQQGGPARLAWKFTARRNVGLWRYYVDAQTGQVLFRYNDLRFIGPAPVCQTSGTIMGLVFDVDPSSTPGPVARPFNHERVYVVDASTYSETYTEQNLSAPTSGFYCGSQAGKMFTQLQGPYVNVSNFRGASAHYDNSGGVWSTASTLLDSPQPYGGGLSLISTVPVAGIPPGAVKVLPVFSRFQVGAVSNNGFGEAGDIVEDDEVGVLGPDGSRVASYFGNRGAFNGAAVPGGVIRLLLKSVPGGQGPGYEVRLSSYLVLNSPNSYGATNDLVWSPSSHTSIGLRGELDLFYHLNLMHDFFANGVDSSGAADISHSVNANAFIGPNILNAFYNPDQDNLGFGDGSDASPIDAFADDATVPHHEYVHYVVEKIWPIQNFGQAGAISEADADYFSATSLNDSSIGTYLNQSFPPNVGPLRELDCRAHPPCLKLTNTTWSGEIHQDSRFLSQALWDLRADEIARLGSAAAGAACVDGLAFQTLLFFPESFQEYYDAIRKVDSLGIVAACGGAGAAQGKIGVDFAAHNLPLGGAPLNGGFESALDVSTLSVVAGAIFPAGDINFYTFAAGPGAVTVTMTLPQAGSFFSAYALTLFDVNHHVVATASPPYDGVFTNAGACTDSDCTTTASKVTLRYSNRAGGQFFLQVAGGLTFDGGSNSGVNNASPYTLSFSFQKPGALAASLVTAFFDQDAIGFTVNVATFARQQSYNFAYAQLRDQSQNALPNTKTQTPAQPSDFLVLASSANGLGTITGQVKLVPGFAARFPAVGTVYLEVFGYDVAGSTVSLGLSLPLNLTAAQADFTAWNNVFNPLKGEKATIKYAVQSPGRVTIKLFTMSGTLVATLLDGDVPAGKGSLDWYGVNTRGTTVASGIYLMHISAPGFSKTQKIAVVK